MSDGDVASTLSELERKLRELEDELQAPTPPPAARAGAASPTAAWRTASPAPAPVLGSPTTAAAPFASAEPMQPVPAAPVSAQEQLDELLQFRGELERSAQQLMADYERVLGSLRSNVQPPAPIAPSPPIAPGAAFSPASPPTLPPSHASAPQAPPAPAPAPVSVPPVPLTSVVEPAAAAPAPWQPAPAASVGDLDEVVMDGAITVDAGPFTDITSLSGFEQALGGVPGVRDVYVRGFEGSRAMIDVTLGQPVALGTELRRFSPVSFAITSAAAGRLSVAIQGA